MFLPVQNLSPVFALLVISISSSGIAIGHSDGEGNPSTQGAALISQQPARQNQTTGQAGSQRQPERVEIEELTREIYNHLDRGNRLTAAGQYDEAIAEYKLAIDKAKGKYAEAYYNLGIALMDRGDLAGSEGALRSAIEQDEHGLSEAHYNLGLVLEKQGRLNDAVEQYKAYLQGVAGRNQRGLAAPTYRPTVEKELDLHRQPPF